MSSSAGGAKPRVLALSSPGYTDEEYLADFKSKYEFCVLTSTDRAGAIPEIADLVKRHGPFDAVMVHMGTLPFEPFDEALFGALVPHCKVIASCSAGYNEFDVNWMTRNKIWFCNSRNAVSEATADMSMFLILAVLKNTTVAEKSARGGNWRNGLVPTRDPSGMTLGIVGMGNIGKHLARKALIFNMKIKYYNRTRLPADVEAQYSATYCSTLDELLSTSDIVSINSPLNASTKGLIGCKEFAKMKDGAYFVNTARGKIVDEDALIEALELGKVKMAGLDVFPNEPEINPYYITSDKVILQPHMGGLTDGAFSLSERECFENIKACLSTGTPIAPVNFVERTNL
ncbi:uncharacterized protein PADG_05619 [Paracoccidioides brasiliensis Pb18]|uniref:Glycerate-and formate-dehydrogenase n=1 Tax=Paracoccidioides brasiliensis (strain Pb18) TaxID=502780 RepID=C1GED3_PARBD|nr:uncharacterized protein PADG_05619 [Paracoccidioides brasiliensis Pb18]EEH49540.1 hypothetical protein PADG_05619 [Paracoccidioides brasiliensis Pb18]